VYGPGCPRLDPGHPLVPLRGGDSVRGHRAVGVPVPALPQGGRQPAHRLASHRVAKHRHNNGAVLHRRHRSVLQH